MAMIVVIITDKWEQNHSLLISTEGTRTSKEQGRGAAFNFADYFLLSCSCLRPSLSCHRDNQWHFSDTGAILWKVFTSTEKKTDKRHPSWQRTCFMSLRLAEGPIDILQMNLHKYVVQHEYERDSIGPKWTCSKANVQSLTDALK